jgi:predicted nuclease of predicted toxin-antitoxin system
MKFLIDECLTLELTEEAHRFGFEGYHVAHIGKAGWKDWDLAAFAGARDLILVTNNATDFLSIYSHSDVHPGLVIILPSVPRAAELLLFRAALKMLSGMTDAINQIVQVDLDGTETRVRVYSLPAD